MTKDQEKKFIEIFERMELENPHMHPEIIAEKAHERMIALEKAINNKIKKERANAIMKEEPKQ